MKQNHRSFLTIGLTGALASGKSKVLEQWAGLGAWVLSCDELVREISARPSVRKQIQAQLGTDDPAAIARQIFASSSARKQLEQLLHPLVLREMHRRLVQATATVRVVEVPLLFEARWEHEFDLTAAVVAPENRRWEYARKRGVSRSSFEARSRAQWPQSAKAAHADICIVNESTPEDLQAKVIHLHQALYTFITHKELACQNKLCRKNRQKPQPKPLPKPKKR